MQPEAPDQDVRGVALLMRQGMAAWMRRGGDSAPRPPARATAQVIARAAQRPSAIEQMLVNIVAAMALCNVQPEEINA